MSAFTDSAEKYFSNGWNVIPLMKGKSPNFGSWQRWSTDRLDQRTLDVWMADGAQEDWGIGLPLGTANGLVAVDIDIFDKTIVKEFIGRLPYSPIIKTGKKGATLFYKYQGQSSRSLDHDFNALFGGVDKSSDYYDETLKFGFDFLCSGRQTVLPPSIHIDTGKAYFYNDSDFSFENMTKDAAEMCGLEPISFSTVESIYRDLLEKYKGEDLSKLRSISKKTTSNGGRNDTLVKFVLSSFHKYDLDDLISAAIDYDDKLYLGKRLFGDKSEFSGSSDVTKNATKFVVSVVTTCCRYRADWVLNKNKYLLNENMADDYSYPYLTEHNGFYFKERIVTPSGKVRPGFKESPDYHGLSVYFNKECHLKTNESFVYSYENDYYVSIGKLKLERRIKKITRDRALMGSHMKSFYENVQRECFRDHDYFENAEGFINLENGVLDIKNKKLLAHSPNRFFKYKLEHDYQPDAECPNWMSFLNKIFYNDKSMIDLCGEMLAIASQIKQGFIGHSCSMGMAVMVKALSSTTLCWLLGDDNCSEVPLDKFDEGSVVDMLNGMKVNFTRDDSGENVKIPVGPFKKAVGGEVLIANPKYLKPYNLRCKFKLIFACNNPPKFDDKTDGLYRRLVIIPFKYKFDGKEKVEDWGESFILPEMSGVLNWALDGLERLERNKKFTEVASVLKSADDYRKYSDSVYSWFEFNAEIDLNDHEYKLVCTEMYDAYSQYCLDTGKNPFTRTHSVKKYLILYLKG